MTQISQEILVLDFGDEKDSLKSSDPYFLHYDKGNMTHYGLFSLCVLRGSLSNVRSFARPIIYRYR